MEGVLGSINFAFESVWPSAQMGGDYVGIVFFSLICAALFLLAFKKTSNQTKIEEHKKRILGHVLELYLYKDQPKQTIVGFGHILRGNVYYFLYLAIPLMVMLVPATIVVLLVNNQSGYQALEQNQSFIVRATVEGGADDDVASIVVSEGLEVETPVLRIQKSSKTNDVFWRLKVMPDAKSQESIQVGGVIKKVATLSEQTNPAFSPELTKAGSWSNFENNVEGFIPSRSPVQSIEVNYRRAVYPFLSWEFDSVVLFTIFTLLFGFLLKPFFSMTI